MILKNTKNQTFTYSDYSLYVGFGPPSKQLRDPFEEHED
jgi:hypothetical protein